MAAICRAASVGCEVVTDEAGSLHMKRGRKRRHLCRRCGCALLGCERRLRECDGDRCGQGLAYGAGAEVKMRRVCGDEVGNEGTHQVMSEGSRTEQVAVVWRDDGRATKPILQAATDTHVADTSGRDS